MHITILSFAKPNHPVGYGSKAIKQKAKEMGYEARLIRKCDCQLDFTNGKRRLLYKIKPYKTDVFIVRPEFNRNYDLEAGTIRHLQYCGYTVVNKHLPVIITKNKIRTLQYLEYHHVPVPKTIVVHNREYLEQSVEKLGEFPLIIKNASGAQGRGVLYVPDKKTLSSVMDLLMEQEGEEYLIQEYVKEARCKDLRVFIVGGKIVGSMERTGKKGEFRSNFHLGGSIKKVNLSHEEKSIALKAAKVIGIEVCGVDILRTKEGPKIIEVNSNPGLEAISKIAEVDIAETIIKYAVRKAKTEQTKKENKTNLITQKTEKYKFDKF